MEDYLVDMLNQVGIEIMIILKGMVNHSFFQLTIIWNWIVKIKIMNYKVIIVMDQHLVALRTFTFVRMQIKQWRVVQIWATLIGMRDMRLWAMKQSCFWLVRISFNWVRLKFIKRIKKKFKIVFNFWIKILNKKISLFFIMLF